jgi:hypothetical protein
MADAPLAIVPLAPVAAAAAVWRQRAQLHVTVAVETRWRIVPDATMTPLPPPRAVASPAPLLEHVDVVVTRAHAFQPPMAAPGATAVRLGLYRGSSILDRSLLVYPATAPAEPTMRARRFPLEPPRPAVAAVVDPANPSAAASIGPLSEEQRRHALGASGPPQRRGAVLELPDDLSFGWFQIAPVEQRVAHLQGDEWLLLDGMHAAHPRLLSQLPGAVVSARVYPKTGAPFPLALRPDRLEVDADALVCTVTWRGDFPIAAESAAAEHTVAVALAHAGKAPSWPAAGELADAAWEPPSDEATHSDDAATLEMSNEQGLAMRAALGLGNPEGMPNAVAAALDEVLRGAPKQPSVDKLEVTLSESLRARGGSAVEDFVSSLFYRLEGGGIEEQKKK